jgi:hypothetical protein
MFLGWDDKLKSLNYEFYVAYKFLWLIYGDVPSDAENTQRMWTRSADENVVNSGRHYGREMFGGKCSGEALMDSLFELSRRFSGGKWRWGR